MANLLTYYVPSATSKTSIDFGLKPKEFLSEQFLAIAPAEPLPSPNSAEVWAAAHDCGYGMQRNTRVICSKRTWDALCAHVQKRLQLHLTLLMRTAPAGGPDLWTQESFVPVLESNEKAALSYTLGSIFCRVATERWYRRIHAPAHTSVARFWHYKITSNPAVTLHGGPATKGIQNPDYIAQCNCGTWSAVEAKGALGPMNHGELKNGLGQAMKFRTLTILSLTSAATPPVKIDSSVCVSTYFDKNSLLQVLHLDPPSPEADARDRRELTPCIVIEFADLVHFDQVLGQHQAYEARDAERDDPPSWWIEWRASREVPDLLFGVPTSQVNLQTTLHWAVDALGKMLPVIAAARVREWSRTQCMDAMQRLCLRIRHDSERMDDLLEAERDAWQGFARWIEDEAAGEQAQWTDLLERLWRAPILSAFGDRNVQSLEGLWHQLSESLAHLKRAVELNNSLPLQEDDGPASEGAPRKLAMTTYGLLVSKGRSTPVVPRERF